MASAVYYMLFNYFAARNLKVLEQDCNIKMFETKLTERKLVATVNHLDNFSPGVTTCKGFLAVAPQLCTSCKGHTTDAS